MKSSSCLFSFTVDAFYALRNLLRTQKFHGFSFHLLVCSLFRIRDFRRVKAALAVLVLPGVDTLCFVSASVFVRVALGHLVRFQGKGFAGRGK